MIYVIGVGHYDEQFPHSHNVREKVERLQEFVPRFCKEKGIQLIAEEWCDDARRYQSIKTTYSEDIASDLGIEYLPCDPNIAERAKLQMKSREQIAQDLGIVFAFIQPGSKDEQRVNETDAAKEADAKRERYWLERILARDGANKNTLLVCGHEHADSLVALAKSKGYEVARTPIA
jgi:hypothetical protein